MFTSACMDSLEACLKGQGHLKFKFSYLGHIKVKWKKKFCLFKRFKGKDSRVTSSEVQNRDTSFPQNIVRMSLMRDCNGSCQKDVIQESLSIDSKKVPHSCKT